MRNVAMDEKINVAMDTLQPQTTLAFSLSVTVGSWLKNTRKSCCSVQRIEVALCAETN